MSVGLRSVLRALARSTGPGPAAVVGVWRALAHTPTVRALGVALYVTSGSSGRPACPAPIPQGAAVARNSVAAGADPVSRNSRIAKPTSTMTVVHTTTIVVG